MSAPRIVVPAVGLALACAGWIAPARASEPGIYLEDTAARTETAVAGTLMMDYKGKNLGASMLTFGLVKPKTEFTVDGAHAGLRLPAQPVFRFHFGPAPGASAAQDPAAAMKMLSGEGMPGGASKPQDFVLVALDVEGEARHLVLAQKRAEMKPTNATFGFTVEKVGDGDYRVRPKAPLPRGEYCFFCGLGGSMPEIWAFGVD